jgi:hypothetical protein
MQRKMVAVRARLERGEVQAGFQPTRALAGLARPRADIGRMAGLTGVEMEPASLAEAVEGAKEAEQRIDMSLEMVDIEALDTGKYHALVVQDPDDKRDLQGFCRLSWLYIPRLHDRAGLGGTPGGDPNWASYYLEPSIRNLARAMNEYTAINTYVGARVSINDSEIFRMPWVLHYHLREGYELGDGELETLGRYLAWGGFMFVDDNPVAVNSVVASHRKNLLAALETQSIPTDFEMLPGSHAVYHCYFDFETPPPGGADAYLNRNLAVPGERISYLEGLEVDNRLVAILSQKEYVGRWCGWGSGGGDCTRQFQFGVNLIVFALTQEGSITHRLMESVR